MSRNGHSSNFMHLFFSTYSKSARLPAKCGRPQPHKPTRRINPTSCSVRSLFCLCKSTNITHLSASHKIACLLNIGKSIEDLQHQEPRRPRQDQASSLQFVTWFEVAFENAHFATCPQRLALRSTRVLHHRRIWWERISLTYVTTLIISRKNARWRQIRVSHIQRLSSLPISKRQWQSAAHKIRNHRLQIAITALVYVDIHFVFHTGLTRGSLRRPKTLRWSLKKKGENL